MALWHACVGQAASCGAACGLLSVLRCVALPGPVLRSFLLAFHGPWDAMHFALEAQQVRAPARAGVQSVGLLDVHACLHACVPGQQPYRLEVPSDEPLSKGGSGRRR